MNRMRQGFLAGMLAVTAAFGARAGDALPGDVVSLISTKPFGLAMKDIEGFTGAILRGTPMQMAVMPGMIEAQLMTGKLHLPPDFVDGSRGIFILVRQEGEAQPAVALVLPVKDLPGKTEALKALGSTVESPEAGVYKVSGEGPEFFLAEAGKDYAVYEYSLQNAKACAALLEKWTPAASQSTLTAHVDVAKLYAGHKAQVDAIPANLLQAVEAAAQAGEQQGKKTPPAVAAAQKAAAGIYGEFLTQVISSTRSVTVTADADAKGLQLRTVQELVPGSDLAKTSAACAAFDASATNRKLLALLPAEEFSLTTVTMPPALLNKIVESVRKMNASITGAEKGDPAAQALAADATKAVDLWTASCGSGTAFSYGITGDGTLNMVALSELKAGTGATLSAALLPLMKKLTDQAIAANANKGPFAFQCATKKIGATDVATLSMRMDAKSVKPADALIADLVTKNYTYVFGVHKDIFVLTMGGKAEAEFEAVLKRIDGGAAVAPAQPAKDFTAAGNNLLFNAFYLNAFLVQLADMVKPALAQTQPQAVAVVDQVVEGLTKESPAISGSLSAQATGFQATLSLPVDAIKGAIDEGVKAAMMIQMQQNINRKQLDDKLKQNDATVKELEKSAEDSD